MPDTTLPGTPDVVLIGAGIMSATLGTMLKALEPSLNIAMLETLSDCAQESSQAWDNAGTGHAANCELNYTPQNADGSVDISRALEVNTEFDLSCQLWSYLVRQGDWVHVRHEEAAAFAAGAEAALTGELAVCAGSCGPGNLHLINGLYDCQRSRVPVLAIAAQIPSAELGRNYFQETHPDRLFRDC